MGRYRLERRVGQGGSAEVWLAEDERLGRTVAIKAPLPDALPDARARERFVAEARAAAGLSHPGIVPVYDVIEDAVLPAMVLRYVEGETLDERLGRSGPLPPAVVATLGAELAGALGHAHGAGIVHRDVKPGNVLVDRDGRAQLLDFGIASSLVEAPSPGARPRRATHVLGTLRYMSPEHLRGAPVDARSDLYALGLTLHELLAGEPAFRASTPEALATAQLAGPAPLPPAVPSGLRALVTELLALDPLDRPNDAAAVESRLRTLATELDAGTPPAAAPTVAPTIAPGLPAASAGLALLASREPHAPIDEPGPDGETSLLPVTLTAAMPAVAAGVAPVAMPRAAERPAADPRAAAATPAPGAATAAMAPPNRRSSRRSGLLAGVAGALVVGGIALAAMLGGAWRGSGVAGGSTPGSPASTSRPVASATPAPAPVVRPKPPKRHHGNGNGNGQDG